MRRLATVAAILALAPLPALAAGFECGETGTRALGRGGAFAARADDLSAVAVNPAGLAGLRGVRLQVDAGLPRLDATFTRAASAPGGTTSPAVSNSGGFGVVPLGAVSWDLGTRTLAVALSAYGPSAYGRPRYPSIVDGAPAPQRYDLLDMDVALAFYGLDLAWRPHPDLDVGVGVRLGHVWHARIARTVDAWFGSGSSPGGMYDLVARLDLRHGLGFGVVLGALYRPVRGLHLGLAVRPFPIRFDLRGTLDPAYPGAYLGALDRNGRVYLTSRGASMDLALPPTARLGVRYAHERGGVERFDVEADVVWEGWSVLDRTRIAFDGALGIRQDLGPDDLHPLSPVTVPRAWQDTLSVRIGGDVAVVPGTLVVRAGGFWESGAVPSATTALDFLSLPRVGVGGGLTASWRGIDLSLAYVHVFQQTRTVASGTSDAHVLMPVSPCQPPWDDAACAVPGSPPGAEVGAGRYASGWDLLSVGVTVAFAGREGAE